MYALQLASQEPSTCLDWNNNYGEDPDKCILFHCGPVPQSLMTAKGKVIDHPMFAKVLGDGCAYGCNIGRIRPMEFSFASTTTLDGQLRYYVGSGEFTVDSIPPEFFGCAGVAEISGLQRKINRLGYAGYRHHVGVSPGCWERAVREAFNRYLGYTETEL
jgi:L-fucose isomerase-like protein